MMYAKNEIGSRCEEDERVLLSMAMHGDEKVTAEIAGLKEDFFVGEENFVFKAMKRILRDGYKPEIQTLSDYFKKVCEDYKYAPKLYKSEADFAKLFGETFTTANYRYHIERVKNAQMKRLVRQALKMGLDALETSNSGDKLRETCERIILDLTAACAQTNRPLLGVSDVMSNFKSEYAERMKPGYESKLLFSGIEQLDGTVGGFENGSMTLIGARPSEGKTSLALSIFLNQLKKGVCAGFISLEMGVSQLAERLVSMESGYSIWGLERLTQIEELKKVDSAINAIGNTNGFIADAPNAPLSDVRSYARMMKIRGCKALFIDYAGLISLDGALSNVPHYERQSHISKSIKGLARELNVPVFLLVQLNREAEGKSATLANIRGSGSYEQDADVVIFIGNTMRDRKELYWLSVAKNRQGATGTVEVVFDKERTLFTDPPNSAA